MLLQDRRCVGDRIEAHGRQMDLREARVGLEPLLDGHEMSIHQRAERWQRALRVDERQDDRLSFERRDAGLPAILIDEGYVGHRFARLHQFEPRRRRGSRRGGGWQRRFPNLFHVLQIRVVADDDQRRVDQVARFEVRELFRIPDLIGHGHRPHEALDFFVFDVRLQAIWFDRQDLSLERVLPVVRSARGRGKEE